MRPMSPVSEASVVGHTSGQNVKPKNTAEGLPRMSRSLTGAPVWSTKLNAVSAGPPGAGPMGALRNTPRPFTITTSANTAIAATAP